MYDFHKFVFDDAAQKFLLAMEVELRETYKIADEHVIRVTGEFCGKKIQNKVAISTLKNRAWFMFRCEVFYNNKQLVKNIDARLLPTCCPFNGNIFNITDFEMFTLKVNDINNYKSVIDRAQVMSNQVALSCPVGKALLDDVNGEERGEGIVWHAMVPINNDICFDFIGKTKGQCYKQIFERHVKNKPKNEVDRFAHQHIGQERFEQGLMFLEENKIDKSDRRMAIPALIKYIVDDVIREEIDIIVSELAHVSEKKLRKVLANHVAILYNNQNK